MTDLMELFRHWHSGRSQVQISAALGIDRKTIRKYLAPAIAAGMMPSNGERFDEQVWRELIVSWFPEVADPTMRAVTRPAIAVHHEWIHQQLDESVTVATIAQRLRDDHGVDVSESSVRRYVATAFAEQVAERKATVPRGAVTPGEEAQVDYGKLGMWHDPVADRRVTVWAFAMILACSRMLFVQPVLRMDQSSWCASHVAAFDYFGGTPTRIVCDNLKIGVERPDLYDPKINRAYAEFAAFYDVVIDPARARKPKDKPRIERPMPYIRDSFWRGRTFTSVPQMQDAAVVWCTEVYGRHSHRGIDGMPPMELFTKAEQSTLKPLPPRRFEHVVYHVGKVAADCHVKAGKALYSVPWRLIGQRVTVRTAGDIVQIFDGDEVAATHVLHLTGRSTNFEHYPPHKVAHALQTVSWCRRQADEIGPDAVAVVAELSELNALHRLRAIQGIVGLRKNYPDHRINAACHRAVQVGDVQYRTIKGILVAGTENEGAPAPATTATPALLRGPQAFDTASGQ
ncbi:IS21 family transposase [Gordonia sp. NB41Y]|uniref:IS21 family transposase n=1 Tax=Gordonia sp. NB41Y TaxID=875808 RepID=UPI0006B1CDE8|nr:IS21 family transposase [Gordonia sp. NB41Y]KOY49560.1 integrase [Gordonia sp. NB41Y]WLP90358.1 IS21 family transposase [Gordonia sp. NB41Y]